MNRVFLFFKLLSLIGCNKVNVVFSCCDQLVIRLKPANVCKCGILDKCQITECYFSNYNVQCGIWSRAKVESGV